MSSHKRLLPLVSHLSFLILIFTTPHTITCTIVNTHNMSDKMNESGSDAAEVSQTIEKIRVELRAFETLRSTVMDATDNEFLERYCSNSIDDIGDKLTDLENAATSAGIQLGDEPTESTAYLQQLDDQMRAKSEVELADTIKLDDERVRQVFNELSNASMPEAVQELFDQIVASLAEPVPEDIAKNAKAKDDEPEFRSTTPEFLDAADILRLVGTESKGTLYSTNRMQARWAKDFLGDAYSKRGGELADAAREGKPVGTNLEGGQSYRVEWFLCLCCYPCVQADFCFVAERIITSLKDINANWERVAQELPDTTGSLTAEKLYSTYETVSCFRLGEQIASNHGMVAGLIANLGSHRILEAPHANQTRLASGRSGRCHRAGFPGHPRQPPHSSQGQSPSPPSRSKALITLTE
jgi:hypothetical protein